MYAVIQTGGKQYRVQPGDFLQVEKLDAPADTTVSFDALMFADGTQVRVGNPTVAGIKVTALVKEVQKGEKLRIFKMKRRKGYRRKTGHRQLHTLLHIEDIKA